MAETARRVNPKTDRIQFRTIEDGNAVRQIPLVPEELPEREKEQKTVETGQQRPTISRQVQKNRARATVMGKGFVFFLTVACMLTMLLCINYLQVRSKLITQTETIASLESQLSTLKADNDAYYNQTLASVTLEEVKEAALNRLGMHYATESQIIYYSTDDSSYVRQYQEVPDAD